MEKIKPLTQASAKPKRPKPATTWSKAMCLCGAVEIEIAVPAFWAWHDHSTASRCAHGAAYATYVGCWKTKTRITKGARAITTFEEPDSGNLRSFCKRCGAPLFYGRGRDRKMINIPRALFAGRTGREPLYHFGIDQMPEWTYLGEPLKPLKNYPGYQWTGAAKRNKSRR